VDAKVTMGLYGYPILMAADILVVAANAVPVGKDQAQQVEIARAIAQRFNHRYGEVLQVPQPRISPTAATVPGINDILAAGAARARPQAVDLLVRVRAAIGRVPLRRHGAVVT
jgi:tRNA synthetases class I (W and Y)